MLSRFLLPCLVLLINVSANSQITFQKIFGAGTYCPFGSASVDGSYSCTVDTEGVANYKFNGYGSRQWRKQIVLNGDVVPASLMCDPAGNFIFCGTLIDSNSVANGLIARLNPNGDTINYKLLPPANDGNYGLIARPTLDSNYIFDLYEDGPLLASSSTLYKLDIGLNTLWSVPSGTSGITSSGILQDIDSNFVFTNYDQAGLTSISLEKYNNNGASMVSKTINDSMSCACFSSYCIVSSKNGGYLVGAEYQQQTVIIRLDANLDTVWTKHLNWSNNNSPASISRDRGDGYFLLMNYQGTATMYHINSLGDSVATFQFNPMIITVGSRMERCPDGGYLISGTTYDYFNVSHGFLLKLDSLCRFTPQGHILTSGPSVFCDGDSITLTGPNGTYHYEWSTGDTTQSIVVNSTGTYVLTITATSGNSATLAPVNIFVSNPPVPQIVNHINYLEATTQGSYQWYHNGVMITGAIHDTLQTTLTGNFNVVVTDSVGCIRVSPLFFYSWTGINSIAEKSFSVYPVPADESLHIQGNFKNGNLTISDISGKIIREMKNISSNDFQIPLNDLQDGIYFLQKTDESLSEKFVIIH